MSDKINIEESEAQKIIGTYGVHQYRDWSKEHRIMHKIAAPYRIPPARSGERVTKFLTSNGARKLAASCEFIALKREGFSTFLTLTFDAEARERIASGESSIQKETSRFFDGLQKMYQRGWVAKTDLQKVPVQGKNDKLDYLWVAEAPDSHVDLETGEAVKNPHVHVLMRWSVPFALFQAWADRIEKIWGQGFAHLEKLKSKKKESAAGYLMKALQYLAKASGASDQGTIRGNRYGISKSARAPEWETMYTFAWAKLGQLVERARFKQNRIRKPLEQKRDYLKEQLLKAEHKTDKARIKSKLDATRAELDKAKGNVYYGRNRVTMQGHEAKDRVFEWFKDMGFEWFDKPLSLYTYYLNEKLKKESEIMNAQIELMKNEGWTMKVSDWFDQYEPIDYSFMRKAENWLYNVMTPSDIDVVFSGKNELLPARAMYECFE